MNHDFESTEFSRSLLAGVFAGIAAVIIGLIYNFIFRTSTGFSLSDLINVSTMIFILISALTVAGLVYYVFHHYFKQGNVIYILFSMLFTAVAVYLAMQVNRAADPVETHQFRYLLAGVLIITGLLASFFIPFLYKKDIV